MEHDEQVLLFSFIDYHITQFPELEWLFAIPNGGDRNIIVARKLKAEGVKKGVWDVFLPVPRMGYSGLFIEMKFGDNKLSKDQKRFRLFAEANNFLTKVFYDGELAGKFVLDYIRSEKTKWKR